MLERIIAEAPQFFSSDNALFLAAALGRTIAMTVVGCTLGFTIGLGLAMARRSRTRGMLPFRLAATLYVETFRRIPFLVLLVMVLFAVQPLMPQLPLLGIATIAVTLVATAFLSEIIRAGLDSVPRQQTDGASALNFTPLQTLRYVLLPQSMRVILPPAAAFVVMFIKDTSLASHLGVVELTFSGKILVNRGFSPVLGFGAILALYFALSYPLSRFAARLESVLHHLEIHNLVAGYGAQQILHGVSLSVDRGEVVSLIGPSGSGKSTLLRVLIGLTPPRAGDVFIGGDRVDYGKRTDVAKLRDRTSIVFQQYNLFQNMTVLGNVTIAPIKIKKQPRAEAEARAMALLEKVGMADKRNAYPDDLSGGQQQRVAIARALALQPEILLLDEVTSALDPERVGEVLDTIRGLADGGITMIIVSHEMSFVREVSTRVAMMDEGRVVECDTPTAIFTSPREKRTQDFVGKILRH